MQKGVTVNAVFLGGKNTLVVFFQTGESQRIWLSESYRLIADKTSTYYLEPKSVLDLGRAICRDLPCLLDFTNSWRLSNTTKISILVKDNSFLRKNRSWLCVSLNRSKRIANLFLLEPLLTRNIRWCYWEKSNMMCWKRTSSSVLCRKALKNFFVDW